METVETVYVDAVDGVVDCTTLQGRSMGSSIELELPQPSASAVVLRNLHSITATDITIGSSLSYALSEPAELPLGTVSYTGPVIDKMMLPTDLKSITIVETPKSGILSRIKLPGGLQKLHIRLTDTFSPVDEMNLPSGLLELRVQGEHNCSLEKLAIPPSLTLLDAGTSIQPVDSLHTGLGEIRVVSKSTRLLQPVNDIDPDTHKQFEQQFTLTSSHPVLTDIHKLLPSLGDVSVILDSAAWQTVGNVWCNLLLEGRVHVQSLVLVNNTDSPCMLDFGEVLYRSSRLGRPLCKYLRVVGEVFDYPTSLRVAEAVRKYTGDFLVELDFVSPVPKCALHRTASVLSAGVRDGDLAYHSHNTNVKLENNILSFTKRLSRDEEIDSDVSGEFSDEEDDAARSTVGEKPKPIILYAWVDCGFCKQQDAIVKEILSDPGSDAAKRFDEVVTMKNLLTPQDADDARVQAFPTWVVRGELAPGLKQKSETLEMIGNA